MRLRAKVRAAGLAILLSAHPALAFSPQPSELLGRMESAWRRIKPVEVRLELPLAGRPGEETVIQVPAAAENAYPKSPSDHPGLVPYAVLIGSAEPFGNTLPTLMEPEAATTLTRLDSSVCYLLEGRGHRLWLRKTDLVPLRVEVLLVDGTWASTVYRSPVLLSERLTYPTETVYERNKESTVIERLINPIPPPSQ